MQSFKQQINVGASRLLHGHGHIESYPEQRYCRKTAQIWALEHMQDELLFMQTHRSSEIGALSELWYEELAAWKEANPLLEFGNVAVANFEIWLVLEGAKCLKSYEKKRKVKKAEKEPAKKQQIINPDYVI